MATADVYCTKLSYHGSEPSEGVEIKTAQDALINYDYLRIKSARLTEVCHGRTFDRSET